MAALPWRRTELGAIWKWPHVFWVNIFGWWGEEAASEVGRKWLPRLRLLELLYVVLMAASMVVAIGEKFAKGDIMTNMFTVFATGPGIVGIFKIFQIVRHRRSLKSTMDDLDDMLTEVDGPQAERFVRSGLKRCWIVFLVSLVTGSCISLHWLSRPLMIAATTGEKTRIVDTWPVFIDTWTGFFLSYLFQSPGIVFLGHAFYIFDNIYFCIAQLILSHLEVLRYKLENLRFKSGLERSRLLIGCVKYHTNILRVCKKLRDASSSVIIWQCINTVIMSCSGVFIVTMIEDINANVLLNLGEIILIITVTLYFYCWYSNEVTFQCGNLLRSSYMSEWTEGSEGDKRSLLILMSRTMPPVYFGGILEISLTTFITILKTTFSYYNFLLAVNGNDN
nr:olfactory receptor 82 [Tropidothorax elegans]